jgi:hypothetical protein
MKTFGASAPLKELQKKFGFEPERGVQPRGSSSGGADKQILISHEIW